MQKWEYCAVTEISANDNKLNTYFPSLIQFIKQGSHIEEIRSIHKAKKTKRRGLLISEEELVAKTIFELGEQGWEMVGMGNTGPNHHMVYFKRPKD